MTFRAELRNCIIQLHEEMLAEVAKEEINADYLLRLMATAMCQLLAGKMAELDEQEPPSTDNSDQLQLFEPPGRDD